MKPKYFLNNQRGSIFLQALISIAIFSAVTASIVRLLQAQNNLSNKTTEQFELTYFVDEVRTILSNPKACRESFSGKNARRDKSATLITQIVEDETGNVYSFDIFEKGRVIKETDHWAFTLSDLYLQSDNRETSIESGTTMLHLVVNFTDKRSKRVSRLEREIKVFASIDNSEAILSCYTVRGIGLGKMTSANDSDWTRTSDAKGHFLSKKKLQINTDLSTSSLNLKGPLKIGESEAACLSEIAGSIKYNPQIDSFEVCSGSSLSWRDLNLPAPLKNQKYSLRATFPIKKGTTPKPFKYCAITYKNYDTGECHLVRLDNGRWELNHSSEKSNFGTCEATCFN
ncbi:hypothetical protein [Halobacteriovorax sp. JY17]|uniref:hypothetical protein n=1 Tax=Halobacteriovorax sp. JY17 TaxID=2014617 RepID=UPI000C670F6A|nr:hypothetical protein [Halobacteriovorax sp. JY17]PIK15689.1 MAG: hypothetical protein CES88_02885 [Halobacteriovorax sp. JY17]